MAVRSVTLGVLAGGGDWDFSGPAGLRVLPCLRDLPLPSSALHLRQLLRDVQFVTAHTGHTTSARLLLAGFCPAPPEGGVITGAQAEMWAHIEPVLNMPHAEAKAQAAKAALVANQEARQPNCGLPLHSPMAMLTCLQEMAI